MKRCYAVLVHSMLPGGGHNEPPTPPPTIVAVFTSLKAAMVEQAKHRLVEVAEVPLNEVRPIGQWKTVRLRRRSRPL